MINYTEKEILEILKDEQKTDEFLATLTGEDVKKNLLIVFAGNVGTTDVEKFNAWNTKSTLILDHFDSVAEKIYFNFSIYEIV